MKKKLFALLLSSALCSITSVFAMEKEEDAAVGITTTRTELTPDQIQEIKNTIIEEEQKLEDLRKNHHTPLILPECNIEFSAHNAWVLEGSKEYAKVVNGLLNSIKQKKHQIYTSLPDEQKYVVQLSKRDNLMDRAATDEYVIWGFLNKTDSKLQEHGLTREDLNRTLEATKKISTQLKCEYLTIKLHQQNHELNKKRTALKSLKEAMEDETTEKAKLKLKAAIRKDKASVDASVNWRSQVIPADLIDSANSWLEMDLLNETIQGPAEQAEQQKMMSKLYQINRDIFEAQEKWKSEKEAKRLKKLGWDTEL